MPAINTNQTKSRILLFREWLVKNPLNLKSHPHPNRISIGGKIKNEKSKDKDKKLQE
jgi:hypothetical protein